MGVVRNVGTTGASFDFVCGLEMSDPRSSTEYGASEQSCSRDIPNGNSNPCMLLQPSDVVAVSDTILYVTYFQVYLFTLKSLRP